jgi:hypothetical protein
VGKRSTVVSIFFPKVWQKGSSVLFFFTCCKLTKIFSLMSFCFLVYNELRKRYAVQYRSFLQDPQLFPSLS